MSSGKTLSLKILFELEAIYVVVFKDNMSLVYVEMCAIRHLLFDSGFFRQLLAMTVTTSCVRQGLNTVLDTSIILQNRQNKKNIGKQLLVFIFIFFS